MATTLSRASFLSQVNDSTRSPLRLENPLCTICYEQMCVPTSQPSRRRSRSPARTREKSSHSTIRARSPISPPPQRRALTIHDSHILCESCIQVWFTSNNTCPFCRREMFTNTNQDDDVNSLNQDSAEDEEDLSALPRAQYITRDTDLLERFISREGWVKIYHDGLNKHGDRRDIIFATREIADIFSRRAEIFRPQVDLRCWGYGVVAYSRVVIPSHDEHTLRRVNVENARMVLWRWWWHRFISTCGRRSTTFVHHPFAMELLHAVFKAIMRWNGFSQQLETTRMCVKLTLKPLLEKYDDFGEVNSQAYFEDLVEAAAQAVVLGRIDVSEGSGLAVAPVEAYKHEDHGHIMGM